MPSFYDASYDSSARDVWDNFRSKFRSPNFPSVSGTIGTGFAESIKGHYSWLAGRPLSGVSKHPNPLGFFRRGPLGHMAQGGVNLSYFVNPKFLPFELSLSSLFALSDTRTMDMFNVQHGFARNMFTNIMAGPGFALGGAVGAAVGALLPIPGATLGGFLAGGFLGGSAPDLLLSPADMMEERRINKLKRYQDSPAAYTMRQRSMMLINQSHVAGRGVLGKEAMSFHM